jgi:hypothetical protein
MKKRYWASFEQSRLNVRAALVFSATSDLERNDEEAEGGRSRSRCWRQPWPGGDELSGAWSMAQGARTWKPSTRWPSRECIRWLEKTLSSKLPTSVRGGGGGAAPRPLTPVCQGGCGNCVKVLKPMRSSPDQCVRREESEGWCQSADRG